MNITQKMFKNEIGRRFVIDYQDGIYIVKGTLIDYNDLGVLFDKCVICITKGQVTSYNLAGKIFKTYEALQYIPVNL